MNKHFYISKYTLIQLHYVHIVKFALCAIILFIEISLAIIRLLQEI